MVSNCVTEHFKPEPQQVKIASKGVLAGRLTLTPRRDPMHSISDLLFANVVRLELLHKKNEWVGVLPADTKGKYPNHSSAENELCQSISNDQDAKVAAAFEAIHGKDGAI